MGDWRIEVPNLPTFHATIQEPDCPPRSEIDKKDFLILTLQKGWSIIMRYSAFLLLNS